ncbi:MAG: cob(I)yrinic acid a,c-diamide adenosyltransferase [Thermodesulfobacteria bacterium]|nr:cob(I)yrinic acid a,c-diamide adenosyltransferase [Thermodesulfobacteriota bacterium]
MKKGLLMVFTGNGKGKTTSALGLAMRAAGHSMKVAFYQFIKGSWKYGEMEAMKRFSDLVDFQVLGRGFTWQSDDLEKDKALAKSAWEKAKEAIFSGKYHMVILDEFTYVLNYEMVDQDEVLTALKARPQGVHVVITGRNAPEALLNMADLVTEMKEIKHPYQKGIKAQKGVEF